MFRRPFRSWLFWIVAVFGLAALVGWYRNRPLDTVQLTEGSTLSLRKVTHGTRHAYYAPVPRDAGILEVIRHVVSPPKHHVTEEVCDMLHLRFRLQPTRGLVPSSPDAIEIPLNAHHVARHELQFAVRGFQGSYYRGHTAEGTLTARSLRGGQEDYYLVAPIVDRRQPTFQLRFKLGGRDEVAELRNPFYRDDWPTWTAQPFPVRAQVGDFAVTMRGWAVSKGAGPSPDLRLEYRGEDLIAELETEYRDATGQRCEWPALPRSESAWKVRVKVATTDLRVGLDQKPVWLEALPPAPGEVRELPIPPEMAQAGVHYLALLDGGPFQLEVSPEKPPLLRRKNRSEPMILNLKPQSKDSLVADVGDGGLSLLVLERTPFSPQRARSKIHRYARPYFLDAAKSHSLILRPSFHVGSSGPTYEHRTQQIWVKRPPTDQPVRIRCHWPEVFEVEFTVAPPPRSPHD